MVASSENFELDGAEAPQASAYLNFLAVAWRHVWLIVLGAATGLALGLLYYSRQPAVYTSAAQVIVIKKGMPLTMDDGRTYQDFLTEHTTFLKSPKLVQLATKDENFAGVKGFGNRDPVPAILGSLGVTRETGRDAAAVSNVLNITFSGPDPEDCPLVLNAVVATYQKWLNDQFKSSNKENLDRVLKVSTEMKKDLDEGKVKLEKFMKENDPYLSLDGGRTAEEMNIGNLKGKRADAVFKQRKFQARLEDLERAIQRGEGRKEWLSQVDKDLTLATDGRGTERQTRADRVLELQIGIDKLFSEGFGENHPSVLQLKNQIKRIEDYYNGMDKPGDDSKFDSQVEAYRVGLERAIADTNREIRVIDGELQEQVKKATDLNRQLRQEKDLRDGLAQLERIHLPLFQYATQAGYQLKEDVGGYEAQVIADPQRGRQTAPNEGRILMTAGFLGLCLGFGLAYLADYRDKSFRTPEEIRRRLGVSVIGNIPMIKVDEALAEQPANGELVLDPRLCTYYQTKSFHSEAFRGLRTALYFSTKGEVHKVIQITSPQASDGKSTVVGNLAISIAQSGRKVVLIDADLRKPRLHKMFGVSSDVGLASIIGGEAEIKDAIHETAVPGLSIIPCGPRPANPAELLTSPVFEQFLQVIREQFEYVLIDTPPLLAVSDPAVVAPRMDGVILAIRVSKDGRPNAERAKDILNSLGAKVLGVVVNGAGHLSNRYGYGYGYAYKYAYNYSYDYSYNYDTYSSYHDNEDEANGESAPRPTEAAAETGDTLPEIERAEASPSQLPAGQSGFWTRFFKGRD